MNADLVLAVLNTAAFLLCVSFVSYVMLIMIPFLRHQPEAGGDARLVDWHLFLPCRNEDEVLAETVTGLRRSFPAAHLWCIDDGSTDGTAEVLAHLARSHARVHVVTRRPPDAGTGKGPALNAAWRALSAWLPAGADRSRTVVGVLDADSRLAPDAMGVITGPSWFGDEEVGAVQVQVRVRSTPPGQRLAPPRRLLLRLQDLEFSGPIAAMQMLRRRSASVGMGGNGQFTRLSVLDRIAAEAGTPWHGALLEDFELGLHVLFGGSRTEYCHDTWVLQDGLASVRSLIRQRSRWAQGSMQCFAYLGKILANPKIATAGAVELTYFLFMPWLQLIGSMVYLAATAVLGFYAVAEPGGLGSWWRADAWGVLPLFALFGVAPFLVWGIIYRRRSDADLGLLAALGLGLANWLYGYVQQVASWRAFIRILRNRHGWMKTSHTRPDRPDGPRWAPVPALPGSFAVCRPTAGPPAATRPFAPSRPFLIPSVPLSATPRPTAVTVARFARRPAVLTQNGRTSAPVIKEMS